MTVTFKPGPMGMTLSDLCRSSSSSCSYHTVVTKVVVAGQAASLGVRRGDKVSRVQGERKASHNDVVEGMRRREGDIDVEFYRGEEGRT